MSDTINQVRGRDSEGNYTFLPYDPKAPISEKGLRTSKVMYKVAKTGENAGVVKGNNVCMLLAPLNTEEVKEKLDKLMPHVIDYLESEQDKIVKAAHTSDDVTLSPEFLDIDAIIIALETSASAGRMNKEIITSWFTDNMADMLTVLFADKLGISDTPTDSETQKLNQFLEVYKSKYAGLASNLVSYQPEESDKLLVAMDKCEIDASNDMIGARIKEKLIKMKQPVDMSVLVDL